LVSDDLPLAHWTITDGTWNGSGSTTDGYYWHCDDGWNFDATGGVTMEGLYLGDINGEGTITIDGLGTCYGQIHLYGTVTGGAKKSYWKLYAHTCTPCNETGTNGCRCPEPGRSGEFYHQNVHTYCRRDCSGTCYPGDCNTPPVNCDCEGICYYNWNAANQVWLFSSSNCKSSSGRGCACDTWPGWQGSVDGEQALVPCIGSQGLYFYNKGRNTIALHPEVVKAMRARKAKSAQAYNSGCGSCRQHATRSQAAKNTTRTQVLSKKKVF